MKKRFCSVFALSLVLSLTLCACDAKDPENLLETQPPTDAAPMETQPHKENSAAQATYSYGNMQTGNVPAGNFMQYENTVLFVSCADMNLYAYDMDTGKVSLFCKDAACSHKNASCAARKINCNLEQYDGKVYGMNFPGPVCELKDGSFEATTEGVYHFWHSDGNLYAATEDKSLLVYENGSDKPRILLDEYTGYWETIFDGYLYYTSGFSACRLNLNAENPQKEVLVENAGFLTDGNYIYYAPEDTYYLYRCNMDGSNKTLILDKPVAISSSNFDDEYFYFRLFTDLDFYNGEGCRDLYRFPKSDPSKIEKFIELDQPVTGVYVVPGYDKLFVTYAKSQEDYSWVESVYTVSKDSGEIKLLEMPAI